ncbi:MAG: peptidylprolyl isomerase [Luminiphilus sp.]|nr:peptidylprolyl isomerase [Luminiphilus sp.]
MKNFITFGLLLVLNVAAAQTIVSDGDLTLSKEEVEFALAASPPPVREGAKTDEASRYEFFVNLLVSKKILARLEALDAKDDPATYYQFYFQQLEFARQLDQQLFQDQLALPDFEALAAERYKVSKSEIAPIPEIREASHILLLCTEGCAEETEAVATLEALKKRILNGDSFANMAIEFSQDPGSKTRGGRLSQGIASDAENVDQSVRDALFDIDQIGDISEVVQSRFGFHLLKLESVTPSRTRSFEEVRSSLVAEIEKRFRADAYQEHILSLAPLDTIEIDGVAFDSLIGSMMDQ